MTCSRCGAANLPGAKFCPACGNALPRAVAAAAAPAPAAAGMPGYNIVSDHLPGNPLQEPLPPGVQKTTNGLAIASMVLGIVWVYWIGSILALIFGYIAKGQINEIGGTAGGPGDGDRGHRARLGRHRLSLPRDHRGAGQRRQPLSRNPGLAVRSRREVCDPPAGPMC